MSYKLVDTELEIVYTSTTKEYEYYVYYDAGLPTKPTYLTKTHDWFSDSKNLKPETVEILAEKFNLEHDTNTVQNWSAYNY